LDKVVLRFLAIVLLRAAKGLMIESIVSNFTARVLVVFKLFEYLFSGEYTSISV
jgi:hypothetical protein